MIADITLRPEIKNPLAAVDRALMFLHEHKAITLQGGLAIMRQAMTIRLKAEDRARRYTMGDFKPLAVHYREKRFQVHVMMEYAQLALDRIARALHMVLDYFSLGRIKFVKKYFADRKEVIEAGHHPGGLPQDRREARQPGPGVHGGQPAGAAHPRAGRAGFRQNHRGRAPLRLPHSG